jgi:hypothetical protein
MVLNQPLNSPKVKNMHQLNEAQIKTLIELRNQGFAVIIWTPEELNGAHPTDIEDASISYASAYLIPDENYE